MANQGIRVTNSIVSTQNSKLNTERLAAQRRLYAAAKKLMGLQLILNAPIMVGIAFVALAFDKQWLGLPQIDMDWLIGASGVVLTLLDVLFFGPVIGRYRENAAKIQQSFDGEVLSLGWNEIVYGRPVDHEELVRWSSKYKAEGKESITDWYSVEVGKVPMEAARIICQRTNCWWDMQVRKQYNTYLLIVGFSLVAIFLVIGLLLDPSLKNFFGLVLAPSLPFIVTGSAIFASNNESIERLEQMKESLESFWDRLLQEGVSDAETKMFAEIVQVGIFTNRKNNPVIFDTVYDRFRDENEAAMNKTAKYYVSQYEAAKGG